MPKPTINKNRSREARVSKREAEVKELESLETAVAAFDIKTNVDHFTDLPLSQQTQKGLKASHFTTLTDIQKRAVPHALMGKDILGAARTGSGKTLAFIIPVLEILYRKKWTQYDGLGALIISPTRELAIQIFEVLRQVGRAHSFSAGLVIGGKDLQSERDRLDRMNILVCTPGRMLQHMDQTAGFEVGSLQVLVLDEADRILDMGFQSTVDAIVDNLPPQRQTLLFSATQTKKISDLARLSLQDPEYVAVHDKSDSATPKSLVQHYIVTPLPDKLDTLYGFMKTHLKTKALVFLSSCKQVRHAFETFCKLHPGVPIMHLHGKQKQSARAEVTARFAAAKCAYLIATDVVARGLDFPAVDWVVQVDAPEDADTYIHRVGRTARYNREGRALLMLCPSEEKGMVATLEAKKVPIEKITIKASKKQTIKDQLQALCFKDVEIKYLAQKAFVSYMRSVYLQRDKETFKIEELPVEEYASSLGLPGAPKIKFGNAARAKALKNAPAKLVETDGESDAEDQDKKKDGEKKVKTKYDRMFERRNQDVLADHRSKLVEHTMDADSDDDFVTLKRTDHALDEETPVVEELVPKKAADPLLKPDSKKKAAEALSKKAMLKYRGNGEKLIFDEEGNAHKLYELEDEASFKKKGDVTEQQKKFVEEERKRVEEADIEDKAQAKEKKREKRRRQLEREREADDNDDSDNDNEVRVELAPYSDNNNDQQPPEEEEEETHQHQPQQPKGGEKRKKKWFEDESENEEERRAKKSKKKVIEVGDLDTLQDYEALAQQLLA
ncbi:ATP-dependent RNA helicase dbp4 [Saitoella coloradoensis]